MGTYLTYESSINRAPSVEDEVFVAVDGSHKKLAHSSAYLATNGLFGVIAANYKPDRCRPHCSSSTELRAAYYALNSIHDAQVTLLTDSQSTVDWLDRWRDGDESLPAWYFPERVNNKASTLLKLQRLIADRATGLTVVKVKAHSGNLLNEGADILAGIGTNTANGIYDSAEGRRRAQGIAESFLDLYDQGVREV